MSIKISDTFSPAGQFELASAKDIKYQPDSVSVEAKLQEIDGILNSQPTLTFAEGFAPRQYFPIGATPTVRVNFSSRTAGKGEVILSKNDIPYRNLKVDRGPITITLPVVLSQEINNFKIKAIDSLGRESNELAFTFIYGGVTLTSTFDNILQEAVYSAEEECTLEIPYSIYYAETGGSLLRQLTAEIYSIDDLITPVATKTEVYTAFNLTGKLFFKHEFVEEGKYILKLTAAVHSDEIDGGLLPSETLTYNFSVLAPNSIAANVISIYTKDGIYTGTEEIDTATALNFDYQLVTNIEEYAQPNALRGFIEIFRDDIVDPVLRLYPENLTSGSIYSCPVGRLDPAGIYTIRVHGQPMSGVTTGITDSYSEFELAITAASTIGSTYHSDGLIAYFDAEKMSNDMQHPDKWHATNNTNYYIQLHGLNYAVDEKGYGNGWLTADDDNLRCLTFTGDSYGIMHEINSNTGVDTLYKPMSEVNAASLGHTLEVVYKSTCIGELLANVLTCKNDASSSTGGYSLNYKEAQIVSYDGSHTERAVSEDTWTHVTFVVDNQIRKKSDNAKDLEDANPTATMRIYINGCLSACNIINNWKFFGADSASAAMPLILNARSNNGNPEKFGTSSFKLLRLYNKPLTSSQVVNNYISSVRIPDIQAALRAKNNAATAEIPTIFFVRNRVPFQNESKESDVDSFALMHQIWKKEPLSPEDDDNTAKNSWVNCTMWYRYPEVNTVTGQKTWATIKYGDVDVSLQGTSSLDYPVKNYKIKVYDADKPKIIEIPIEGSDKVYTKKCHGAKYPFIPPNVSAEDGWFEDTADNVYTLKCDYMEQSHKNNTGTAIFYEKLVDAAQDDAFNTVLANAFRDAYPEDGGLSEYANDKLSRARQEKLNITVLDKETELPITKEVSKYRDAINGFSILVYYNDNDVGEDLNLREGCYDSTSSLEVGADSDRYAGTYMFNVDKEGKQLGFKIETSTAQTIKYNLGDSPDTEKSFSCNQLPCISLEGSSNITYPGAAAFYTLEEYNAYGVEYDEKGNVIEKDTYSDEYEYIKATLDPRYTYTDEYTSSLSDAECKHLTFHKMKETIDWVSGIVNYTREMTEEDVDAATYAKNLEIERRELFRSEFPKYFSLTYCLLYYLQMQVFAQVDNAGKNAMFDTWGGKWYPRPYDMDTQMGLDNSGFDTILPSVEINSTMASDSIIGNKTELAKVRTNDNSNHIRFRQFNTRNSHLWNSFAKYYDKEIQDAYKYFRDKGIYKVSSICAFAEELTTNIIGETFYNKDAVKKYLNTMTVDKTTGAVDTQYLYACQGNRANRYKQFLNQRITFLDTKYKYIFNNKTTESGTGTDIGIEADTTDANDCLNSIIKLRSDIVATVAQPAYLGISVYSPQYITIDIGTDCNMVVYVDENTTHTTPGGAIEPGILLELPLLSINKDWRIYGAANIREITHMPGLQLTGCWLSEARKLTNFAITNSDKLSDVSLTNNTYLRYLDLSGNSKLDVAINLENCRNLKHIDVSNSAITGITLPEGAPIANLDISGTNIGSLSLKNLQSLTDEVLKFDPSTNQQLPSEQGLILKDCPKLTSVQIINVPCLTTFAVNNLPQLKELEISQCSNLASLNLSGTRLDRFTLGSVDELTTLNLSGCSGNILKTLNLSTAYKLTTLNLASASCNDGIHVLLPKFKKGYVPTGNATSGDSTLDRQNYWNELAHLDASNSTLTEIYYEGSANYNMVSNPATPMSSWNCAVVDLSHLTNLTSFSFSGNKKVQVVKGLTYSGSLASKFYGCAELLSVTGTVTNCSSLASAFYKSAKLRYIDQLNFSNSTATSATNVLHGCSNISASSVNNLIRSNLHITAADSAFRDCTSITSAPTINIYWTNLSTAPYMLAGTRITSVPSKYFYKTTDTITSNTNTKLSSLAYCFYNCTQLTSVDSEILKDLTGLTNIIALFSGCTQLTNFLNSSTVGFDVLPQSPTNVGAGGITRISYIFNGCSKLAMPETGTLYDFFKRVPRLEHADAAFSGVATLESTHISEITGQTDDTPPIDILNPILSNNTALKSITGLFGNCTGLTSLPNYLCSTSVDTHENLVYAGGLFAGCTNITGTLQKSLFTGMEKVKHLGLYRTHVNIADTGRRVWYLGAFANTSLTGISADAFESLTELLNISTLFAKASLNSTNEGVSSLNASYTDIPSVTPKTNGSTTLQRIYIPGTGVVPGKFITSGLVDSLFASNSQIVCADSCFAGNAGFTKFCDVNGVETTGENLFKASSESLISLNGTFANCCYQQDPNVNNYQGLEAGKGIGIFKNLKALAYANYTFAGCKALTCSINNTLLSGCESLISVQGMFNNCTSLGFADKDDSISIPHDLFNSCRSTLTDTSYMFANCGFKGRIGVGKKPSSGSYAKKGLLADCLNLNTTKSMFSNCTNLKGAIPQDIFYSSITGETYEKLTDISYMFNNCWGLATTYSTPTIEGGNTELIYESDFKTVSGNKIKYLVPKDWLSACPQLTNIEYLFNNISSGNTGLDEPIIDVATVKDDSIRLILPNELFNSIHSKITTADYCFANNRLLTGALSGDFLKESLNVLTSVKNMFAFTYLTSVGSNVGAKQAVFQKSYNAITDTITPNTTLANITMVFYGCSSLSGYGPEFYNSAFTALTTNQQGAVYGTSLSGDYTTVQRTGSTDHGTWSYKVSGYKTKPTSKPALVATWLTVL